MSLYSASTDLPFSFDKHDTPQTYTPHARNEQGEVQSPFMRGEPSEVESWHRIQDVAADRIEDFHTVEETALGGMEMLLHAEMTEMERRKIREALTMYMRQEFPDQAMADQAKILLDTMMNEAEGRENEN